MRVYTKAVTQLQTYNQEARKIVGEASDKLDTFPWTTLKNKTNARDATVKSAETAAGEARQLIESIEKSLYKNEGSIQPEPKEGLKKRVRTVIDNLESAKKSVYEVYESADLTEKYWKNE